MMKLVLFFGALLLGVLPALSGEAGADGADRRAVGAGGAGFVHHRDGQLSRQSAGQLARRLAV